MRIVQIKKRTAYAIVILLLAFIIWSLARIFTPVAQTFLNSKELSAVNKQVGKTYKALDGKFSFVLPESWVTWSESFGGNEIIYHLYFRDPNKKINGFIQVWKLNKSLKQFLEESKKSAVGAVDFKYFNISEIMSGRNKGYLVVYSRKNDKDEYIKAYEAFIEGNDNNVYRASFFVKEEDWKNYYPAVFNKIIKSFEIS